MLLQKYLNDIFKSYDGLNDALKNKEFKRAYDIYNKNVEFYNKTFNENYNKYMSGEIK